MKQKSKRWTHKDEFYVRENYGRVSLEEMAKNLCRTPMSVRLYILRKRLTSNQKVKRNILQEMLRLKFKHLEDFSPTKTFYKETKIGQRRFWDLYFGRKPITEQEYIAVAEYLGITLQKAFDSRQLNLFEEYD